MFLFRTFILRRLIREPLRSGLTTIGIALGVAVVVAIQLTNASSIAGFETALNAVSGRASLEIVGTGVGVDELTLNDLGWLRQFGDVAPVIEGQVVVREPGQVSESLRVLGVDVFRDRALRDYEIANTQGDLAKPQSDLGKTQGEVARTQRERADDPLSLLLDPASAILTAKFAEPRGLKVGDALNVIAGDRNVTLTIRGLLKDEGPARLLDGRLVLMDIAGAQLLLGKLGRIDRIDIRVIASDSLDEAERTIGSRLPAGLSVQRPAQRGRQVEQMLAAFHLNLTALSSIALVVGLFLVYNTISVAVLSRRAEIGVLRALGVSRGRVRALFLAEAAAIATVGSAIGIGVGRLLADAAVALTSTTVSSFWIATASAPPDLDWTVTATAFAVGVPLSLIAAAVPAQEASRIAPLTVIRNLDEVESRAHLPAKTLAAGAGLLVLAVVLATRGPANGLPIFGYASAFAVIFGAALFVPVVLFAVAKALRRRDLFGIEEFLAINNISASVSRLAISVAALAVSLSMTVAIAVMVGSFRETLIYWVGQTLRADLFVSPASTGRPSAEATLSDEVVAAVTGHADVLAVDRFRFLDVPYASSRVRVGTGDFDVILGHGNLVFKAPADGRAAMRRAIGQDAVVASEAFTIRYNVRVGDRVSVPAPAGPATFTIAAVYYDYSNDRGVLMMDRGTFERHFGRVAPSGLTVYLKPGVNPDESRTRLLSAMSDERAVSVNTNHAVRTETFRIFDSTFAITWALELVAIVVAILGIAGTLLTLVLERERDFATLRAVGASRSQVRRIVVGEAVVIGAISQAIGIGVGLAISTILIYVVNVQSFGWTIQFHLPAAFLVQSSILVVLATAVAGLYPARRAVALATSRHE